MNRLTSCCRRVKRLALLWISASSVACGVSADSPRVDESAIPAPSWIESSELVELEDGRLQLSFETDEQFPSSRVRDFYADWADVHGWSQVSADAEPWSADRWVTYNNVDGVRLDQWTVHWQSPDGDESLVLALLHVGDRSRQEAYVIRSPFFLLDEDVEVPHDQDPLATLVEPDPCPQGVLQEPVPLHRPLPPVDLLEARCPERLNAASPFFTINPEGRIASVDLLHGSGCARADDELRRCILEWVFEPAICDGEPVAVQRGFSFSWEDTRAADSEVDEDPCPPFQETQSSIPE